MLKQSAGQTFFTVLGARSAEAGTGGKPECEAEPAGVACVAERGPSEAPSLGAGAGPAGGLDRSRSLLLLVSSFAGSGLRDSSIISTKASIHIMRKAQEAAPPQPIATRYPLVLDLELGEEI